MTRCYHCQSKLLERQTHCLACGSPSAREEDFWKAFNEGVKARGLPEVDPYAAEKEIEMYAQMDTQRLEAKRSAVQGVAALTLETNDRVRDAKSRARVRRES